MLYICVCVCRGPHSWAGQESPYVASVVSVSQESPYVALVVSVGGLLIH